MATGESAPKGMRMGDLTRWLILRCDRHRNKRLHEMEEKIMANFDELGQKIDAQTAKANKAFAEIRKALDDALAAQITQAELDAAVADAKAAQKAQDDAAADAAFASLSDKLATQEAALQKLDDIVPDEPAPEPPAA